ncbi:MAG: DUF1566 domain-containing protein [Myxococcaceae bacterium]|nr:DUF1566 domain-containing protein [Myxococcaceae bacterium]MBH2006083.1 DUF1566 domain-containing protein [Myxococcaceae bacterium]
MIRPISTSIVLVFALSTDLLAWLKDPRSEVARISRQIRDSVREVKPFSLGSSSVPLIRTNNNYIEQMSQRLKRIQELRLEIHRLHQIGKMSEALEAEEELLRLIELGALPEKLQRTEAWKIGLGLSEMPGELFLPTSGKKYGVPELRLLPGTDAPSVEPNPSPADVGQASQAEQEAQGKEASIDGAIRVVRTQAMSVDPLRSVRRSYTGPREPRNITALKWDCTNLEKMTFQEAQAYATSRLAEGWELPTIWELEALYRQQHRELGNDCNEASYWSETAVTDVIIGGACHWVFDFEDADVYGGSNFSHHLVCLVRDLDE